MRGVAGLLLLAALPACGSGAPAEPAPSLTGEARQYRRDIALRLMSVAVTNPGPEPVVVERLQLDAGGFEPVPQEQVDVEVPGGQRVDVKVTYGPARCAGGVPDEDAAAAVVRTAGGSRHDLRIALPEGSGTLERLRAKECAERALRETVALELSPSWQREGDLLTGGLRLVRGSADAGEVAVTEPGGNILFTIGPRVPARPMLVLPAGQQAAQVPLQVRATRCDGHALAESKRSYVFLFFVAVDGGTPLQTSVTADEPLQRQLDRLALDTCRPGTA